MEPIRTDFAGYEGMYVAIDHRTGKIVMADENHHRLADRMKAEKVTHAAIRRVPRVGEPQYVGLG
ncbi:MAG: hypothetical protein ABIS21_03070 [Acidimicrobiales bacterium]